MVLTATIAYWVYTGEQTLLLGEGKILLFGEVVPWQLKVIYGFWLIQLLSQHQNLICLTRWPLQRVHDIILVID